MKNERGHGPHWSIFGNPEEFLPELLPQLFQISKVDDFGQSIYSIDIMTGRDPDITIPLFAPKSHFEAKPKKKDAIRGVLWLQGCMDKNTDEQI